MLQLYHSRLGMIVACGLLAGCGKPSIPSYSVAEAADKLTVTLHTTAGDIPVDIAKRTSGNGTRNGTRSRDGSSLRYDIEYSHAGDKTTLTSVKLDGQEIPKAD